MSSPVESSYTYEDYKKTADWLMATIEQKPKVAIICGSGLGGLADLLQNKTVLSYKEIPDFPQSTGMSTVPEVVVARHCRLRVLGLSIITNMVVSDYNCTNHANHEEVLEAIERRAKDLQKLVSNLVSQI